MKKKRNLMTPLLILMLFAGLSLLLYPTFADYWNSFTQTRAIAAYSEQVQQMNDEGYTQMWADAEAYNAGISTRSNLFVLSDEEKAAYNALLDVLGIGIMGYVEIPTIDVSLPLYHGTDSAVLQTGIGHLEWSSLPVGGAGTHCVLSGHRGLPSARLFTDLDQLVEGDLFYLRVLDQVLTYEIDQILIVEPTDTDELKIVEGQDYCTLVTCTPYGINSHRLLVRGTRILDGKPASGKLILSNEIEEVSLVYIVPVALTFFVVVMLCAIGIGSLTGKKTQRKHKKVYRKEKGREKEQNDL